VTQCTLETLLESAVPFALSMRRTFRGLSQREGMVFEGPSGWGEFAPFDDYSDAAASLWLDSAIEAAYGTWPVSLRTSVNVNAILPACSPDDAAALTRIAINDHGCRTIKVKVGGTLAEDEARVASIRDVLDNTLGRGSGSIRIDANAAWDAPAAITALRRLGAYGLEYVEQPCREMDQIREVRSASDVPIAVDETIRMSDDPLALAHDVARIREIADFAILKPSPLGGIAASLRVAEALPVPVIVSSSMDSSVGLAAAVNLAGILGLDAACGLGTGALLSQDLVSTPVIPSAGMIPVRRVAPDGGALAIARAQIGDERAQWWRNRLIRAWEIRSAR
jgi:O-succinylbenzoate synthase